MNPSNYRDALIQSRIKVFPVFVQRKQRKGRAKGEPRAPARHEPTRMREEEGRLGEKSQRKHAKTAKDAFAATRSYH
jgi:hypothetical protein